MKTTPDLSRLLIAGLLLLAGCKSGGPAPVQTQPAASTGLPPAETVDSPPAGEDTAPGATPLPTLRPTSPAVEALSAGYPAFDGLYWTPEVAVTAMGQDAVSLMSGLPCSDVLGILSSGEWLVDQVAVPPDQMAGMASTLALLSRGERVLFADLKDLHTAPVLLEGEPTPTPDPAADPPITGCVGALQPISVQQVSAQGSQQAEGQALQFPLLTGCTLYGDQVSASLFYEGPGDFRAWVSFTVPYAAGAHQADWETATLEFARSDQGYVDQFAAAYAGGSLTGEVGNEEESAEYYPMEESTGTVTLRSLDPLTGEVHFGDWMDDYGEMQTFQAGFQCAVKR